MMKRTSIALAACAVACLAFAGLASAQVAAPKSATPPRYESGQPVGKAGAPEPPPDTDDSAPARWEPVLIILSVEVMRSTHGNELDIVRVRGLTSTNGWNNPQLVPITKGKPVSGTLDLLFLAQTPSEAMEPTGFSPVDAIFVVEPSHPYKNIRVHGATNRVTLKTLPGYAETPAKLNDCANCIGKYFVAKGATAPAGKSAAEIVNEADLPSTLRLIKSSDGIGKLETEPNRLTLMLDEDGRIDIAVWD